MSGPRRPTVSTNLSGRGAPDNTPRVNSPLSGNSFQSNPRNKRPAPARTRGNSPHEKRVRGGPPSPPKSRTGSGAGLPANVPTGPARVLSSHDKDLSRRGSTGYSPQNVQSPTNISGASTPVQNAPSAPSMLPRTAFSSVQAEKTTPSLAALQGLKARKQALHNATKSQSDASATISSLTKQLEAEKAEKMLLAQTVKSLEHLPGQMIDILKRLDAMPDFSDSVKTIAADYDKIVHRLNNLETASEKRNIEVDILDNIKNDILEIKERQDAQAAASTTDPSDAVRSFVQQEIKGSNQSLWDEVSGMEARCKSELDKEHKAFKGLSSRCDDLDAFRQDVEKKMSNRLDNLTSKVNEVTMNESKAYKKLERHIDDFEDYVERANEDFDANDTALKNIRTTVGQVKEFQSELGKLRVEQERLVLVQDEQKKDMHAFGARVQKLEQNNSTLLNKTTTTTTKNAGTGLDATIAAQLKQLSNDIQVLKSTTAGIKESQKNTADPSILDIPVTTIKAQLKSMDELPKQVETLTKIHVQLEEKTLSLEDKVAILDNLAIESTEIQQVRATVTELQSKVSQIESRVMVTSDISPLPANRPLNNEDLATLRSQFGDLDANVHAISDGLNEVGKIVHDHSSRIEVVEGEVSGIFRSIFDPFRQTVEEQLKQNQQSLDDVAKTVTQLQQQPHDVQPPAVDPTADNIDSLKHASEDLGQRIENLKMDMVHLQATVTNEASLREQEISGVRLANDGAMESMKFAFHNLQTRYDNINTDDLYSKMVQWFLHAYPNNTAQLVQRVEALQREVQRLAQSMSEIGKACQSSTQALTKVQSLNAAVGSLQQSLHILNSDEPPFVKMKIFNELHDEMKELNRTAGAELNRCVEEIQALKNSNATEASRIDLIQHNFIEPNREAFGMFGELVELVRVLQDAIQTICENVVTKDGGSLQVGLAIPDGHGPTAPT